MSPKIFKILNYPYYSSHIILEDVGTVTLKCVLERIFVMVVYLVEMV
jgi:hypothetical protein